MATTAPASITGTRTASRDVDVAMGSPATVVKTWAGLLVLCSAVSVTAQLPLARLSTIDPPGGKTGSTFEVTVTGTDLEEAGQLHFSRSNITARPKIVESTGQPEPNKFVVTIAPEVPPDIYEARFVGRFGISNPRAFIAGDLNEISDAAKSHAITNATEVVLGTVINGHTSPNAADYFRFKARKGQRVLVDCAAKAIDSRLEPVLILQDARGRELERNRNGGLLDCLVPEDGEFVLQAHDITFRGGGEFFYRLTIGLGPHIDFIFPPAGSPGSRTNYILYGRNLPGSVPAKDFVIDGKPLEQLGVEIELPVRPTEHARPFGGIFARPAFAVLSGFLFRLTTALGVSNPAFISFATAPVVAEKEPNNSAEMAQSVPLPCEVVGQFYPAGDQDWFSFSAKKGSVYWLEVFSQRLALPVSPFMLVQKITKPDKGEVQVSDVQEVYASDTNVGGNEFRTTTLDPATRLEVKEDAVYRVQIRDLFNHAPGDPRRVYRLSLRPESPDFRLIALAQPTTPASKDKRELMTWSPLVRRGETIPLKVLALRRDGFNGDIQLSVDGLPPGVTASAARIESGKNSVSLLLTATEQAAAWVGDINVVGKAVVNESVLTRDACGGALVWNVGDYNQEPVQARLAAETVLAVSGSEIAPLSVEPVENKVWEAPPGGKVHIPIRIIRRGDFTGNLKLKAAGLAALDGLKEIEVDGKATNATLVLDLTQQKIPGGTHNFHLQTQATGKYRNNPEAAVSAENESKAAEKLSAELAATAKQSADALAAATKAFDEAAATAKTAHEKLASAKTAADNSPEKEELKAARASAEKEAAEADAKSKAAAESKSAAETTSRDASIKAKEAESRKTAAANRAKEASERAKPRDVTLNVYSAPIVVQVTATETK